jgi:hypothetical protein
VGMDPFKSIGTLFSVRLPEHSRRNADCARINGPLHLYYGYYYYIKIHIIITCYINYRRIHAISTTEEYMQYQLPKNICNINCRRIYAISTTEEYMQYQLPKNICNINCRRIYAISTAEEYMQYQLPKNICNINYRRLCAISTAEEYMQYQLPKNICNINCRRRADSARINGPLHR